MEAKRYIIYTILGAIFFWGFFLRFYQLGYQSYWIDEGFTVTQANAIYEHGYPLLDSGIVDIKDALLPYLLALPRLLMGEGEFSMRIISVIFGAGSICIIFLLVKNLFNKYVGIGAAFMLAFSYWHIAWSRQVRGYALLIFFTLLAFLFFYYYDKFKTKKFFLLTLLSIFLATLSKMAGIIFVFPFAIYLLIKKKYKESVLILLLLSAGAVAYKFLFMSAINASLVNYFNFYFFGYFLEYFGLVFILAVMGIAFAIYDHKDKRLIHLIFLLYFIISLVIFSFFIYVGERRYLFMVTPLFFIYASYFMYYIVNRRLVFFSLAILLLTAVDYFTVKSLSFFPQKEYYLEEYTPQPDFRSVYNFIKKEDSGDSIIVSPYPYMDKIYFRKPDFTVPISYTGKDNDSNIVGEVEYYSGVPRLYEENDASYIDKIAESRLSKNVYVILDDMAEIKMDTDLRRYVIEESVDAYKMGDMEGQTIYLYKIERKDSNIVDN